MSGIDHGKKIIIHTWEDVHVEIELDTKTKVMR